MTDRPDLLENLGNPIAVKRAEIIAKLNDGLRLGRRGPNDMTVFVGDLASHIDSLEDDEYIAAQVKIGRAVALFKDFSADNAPWGERDGAGFELDGDQYRFKIDYYDTDGRYHSPDPTDPAVTKRVLTIFYSSDY